MAVLLFILSSLLNMWFYICLLTYTSNIGLFKDILKETGETKITK